MSPIFNFEQAVLHSFRDGLCQQTIWQPMTFTQKSRNIGLSQFCLPCCPLFCLWGPLCNRTFGRWCRIGLVCKLVCRTSKARSNLGRPLWTCRMTSPPKCWWPMKLCLVESLYSLLWAVHRNFGNLLRSIVWSCVPRDGNYDIASKKHSRSLFALLLFFLSCVCSLITEMVMGDTSFRF